LLGRRPSHRSRPARRRDHAPGVNIVRSMALRSAKYQLLLWDFDGTVADTLADGLRIFNELAERHGLIAIEDPQAVREMNTRAFLRAHKISLRKVPRLLREFQEAQQETMHKVPLHVQLAPVLREMQRRGYRSGIVSSNVESNIRTCLRANGVEDCFEFVIGHSRLFGKRRAIERTSKAEAMRRDEVLCIGDEVRDVEAAQAAGVDMAAVTWGFNSRAALTKCAPTFVVDSPEELLPLIERERPTRQA
jgi:phosphoglycolate phosphatase